MNQKELKKESDSKRWFGSNACESAFNEGKETVLNLVKNKFYSEEEVKILFEKYDMHFEYPQKIDSANFQRWFNTVKKK